MTVKMYPQNDTQTIADYLATLTGLTTLFCIECGGYIIVAHE